MYCIIYKWYRATPIIQVFNDEDIRDNEELELTPLVELHDNRLPNRIIMFQNPDASMTIGTSN